MKLARVFRPGLLRSTILAILLALAFVYAAVAHFDVPLQTVLQMFLFCVLLLAMTMGLAWLMVVLLKRRRR